MHNFPTELSLNDISIQKMSTTVRRQRRASFSTTSLIKYDNNRNNVIFGNGKNRNLSTLFVEEEEVVVENDCSQIGDVIRQLQSELQQTKALVAELETRLERTEQTSQVIVKELKNLLSENESVSHTTAVEIDQELEEDDDMKFDLNDDEFYISSPLIEDDLPNDIIDINDERDLTYSTLSSSQIESITAPSSSQHADDTNDSYNRICSAVQSLINDAQVALQKPDPSSSHQLLGLPQTTTRPRAQSWSSNVSSWIMNHYNTSSMVCDCGTCSLCLESCNSLSSNTTTPKSSRANSISSTHPPTLSLTCQQQESYNNYNKQVNLAGIKKQYRKKLESGSSYRKSCDDLDLALQKLISTAVSAGVEHGLMHSPIYRQNGEFMELDDYSYFRNHDDDEINDDNSFFKYFCKRDPTLNNGNDDNNNKKESSKWRRRIWNCLQKMGIKFNNDKNSHKDNINEIVEEEEIEDGYGSYSSYSSYNSSWKSSSDYQENLSEDSTNPFNLNIGQNIFNFNVNLVNSTTNNYNKTTNNCFNDIDNSINTTNNYQNCYNTINNYEEKSSQLNKEESTYRQAGPKKIDSLATKFTNMLAMIGLIISMSQTIILNPTNTPALMSVAARNMIRSSVKRRRSRHDMILMIKVIKYISVLFVGWAAGRIGNKKRDSSDGNGRIKEIPSNN